MAIVDDFRSLGMLRVVQAGASVEEVFEETEKVLAA
jgi:hypothetical protein